MNERMLTFECDTDREVVQVHVNREGLDYLIAVLARLRDLPTPEHVHLMTLDWGGGELSSEKQSPESSLIKHVKLCKW